MMADARLYVARDQNFYRERADGTDSRPLIAVENVWTVDRFDWEQYVKYFPGFHDWRRASVNGAGLIAANYGGIWIFGIRGHLPHADVAPGRLVPHLVA